MPYKHGVYVSEVPTSVLSPVTVDAGIPFIVGTAPVSMADEANVNKPVLCNTYAEAVAAFGYLPPVENSVGLKEFEYTISEFLSSHFSLYGAAPVIIVNVLDPTVHRAAAETTTIELDSKGTATIAETGIVLSTLDLSTTEDPGEEEETTVTYERGTHYEAAFDDDGHLVISALYDDEGDSLMPISTPIDVAAFKCDPSAVQASDIIGGISASNAKTGLELVADVFPRYRLVPGTIIAPGYSHLPSVAAVMAAKCQGINGVFNAVCVCDLPADSILTYTDAPSWKESNNYTDPYQINCWPLLALDGTIYHMSTQLAGLMQSVDGQNNGVPYVSPSNKNYQMTMAVTANGNEVWLDNQQASYLNGNGIVTAENFIGGWKCWGSRTGAYPGKTDVKDTFIPVRRMFDWIGNTLVQTAWQRLDYPLNRRQIDTVIDSVNIWLNGLTARQYILGGRVEFLESENPVTSLLDGVATFHVYVTPPAPNKEIDFILEYDVSYLNTLFE